MSIVLPEALVLDCTVTVPWYLTDESSELSEALFHALDSHRLVVPVLWRLEFVSAMRAAFRRGRVPAARFDLVMRQAAQLPLQQDPLQLDVADIALGCCVGWLGFRKPGGIDWHGDYPPLARHYEKLMARRLSGELESDAATHRPDPDRKPRP